MMIEELVPIVDQHLLPYEQFCVCLDENPLVDVAQLLRSFVLELVGMAIRIQILDVLAGRFEACSMTVIHDTPDLFQKKL